MRFTPCLRSPEMLMDADDWSDRDGEVKRLKSIKIASRLQMPLYLHSPTLTRLQR